MRDFVQIDPENFEIKQVTWVRATPYTPSGYELLIQVHGKPYLDVVLIHAEKPNLEWEIE